MNFYEDIFLIIILCVFSWIPYFFWWLLKTEPKEEEKPASILKTINGVQPDQYGNIIIGQNSKTYAPASKRYFGCLWRKESFWIGCHYSKECKRYCLNFIPCLTIWWTKKGGLPVDLKRM